MLFPASGGVPTGHDLAMAITEMSAHPTEIEGLLVISAKAADDERGTVREFFRKSAFRDLGVPRFGAPMQVNLTESRYGAIRGLHGEKMTKLVGVAAGSAFGAYADMRPGEASFGKVATVELRPGRLVLVPSGVCNGFQCLSADGCTYLYCFDAEWAPGMAGTAVHPLDPDLGIEWPIRVDAADRAMLSEKDAALPAFAEVSAALKAGRAANRTREPGVMK